MTARKRFKRHVRERARKTGESYTGALAHARRRPEQEPTVSVQQTPDAAGAVIVIAGPVGVGKSTVSALVAAGYDRSVHLRGDDFSAAVAKGWVDPSSPEAAHQNHAVGAAMAVSTMAFAEEGYTTVLDGHLFPDGMAPFAAACAQRGLPCHYAVLSADLETCWARAAARPEGRWPLERDPVAALHARYGGFDLDPRHLVDASGAPDGVAAAVLSAIRAGTLAVRG